jgi:uncharacterized membrane protein YhhN
VAVPIIIFVVCVGAGVFAASQWLPDLQRGTVGGLSFFVVCGLIGAAVGVIGLRIYGIVEGVETSSRGFQKLVVSGELSSMLWQAGLLLGLAAAVYLLAPARSEHAE